MIKRNLQKITGVDNFIKKTVSICFLIILLGLSIRAVSDCIWKFIIARENGHFTACQTNCRNMSDALDKYDKDNNKYPNTLDDLTPDYISEIPTCPATGMDTYSKSYNVSKDRKIYTFFCKGKNHGNTLGLPANYPQYDSVMGLQAIP